MFTLKRARTIEIYRNYLKSMLKCDTILKCFMSNDSGKVSDVLNFMKKKKNVKKEKMKLQMETAKNVFELVKGNDVKEYKEVEQSTPGTSFSKINEIIATAEGVPSSSSKVVIPIAQKTQRKALTNKEYAEKNDFLYKAKQVALALGVDVDMTQKELLLAYETIGDNTPPPSAKFKKRYKEEQTKFANEIPEGEQFCSGMTRSRLNIFKKNVENKETPTLETWKELKKITLLHSSFRPPTNYFHELINWTHQGKLWRFPIDNDQGWDEEIATDFTEHVFLDRHLESWCPKSGPIRHFMELVTTGLSKNPFLSAQKKEQLILWYRDYFQAKSSVLAELGVLDSEPNENKEKIEAGENRS